MSASVVAGSAKHSEQVLPMAMLLDELRSLTDAAGRADLTRRLAAARTRITDPRVRMVVTGESKKGISSLVNALVSADVCPAGTDSPVPVVIEYGEPVTGPAAAQRDSSVREVRATAELLAEGLVLVDAPGITGVDARRMARTLALVAEADAVLFVSDASQELTAPQVRFLEQIHQLCPTVACVLNKIDSYPHWADIQQADRKHLTNAGFGFAILPVSAAMHRTAHRLRDPQLETESGIPQLVDFVRGHILSRAEALARETVVHDVRVVSDHVSLALDTELAALQDPMRGAELVEDIKAARAAAEALRKRTANWQYVLGDGVTELSVAVEHDLRNRLREIIRDSDEQIMAGDPARRWKSFAEQLNDRVTTAVTENFVLAQRLSDELARKVALRFEEDGRLSVPALRLRAGADIVRPVGDLAALDSRKAGIPQRVITSLRGSYGGVLMVGLATSLLGLALLNPYSIGAGVLLGANTFWEDRKTLKTRRQAEAKQAVARLMDEVVFQVNKESKEQLREVQRTLRDHFTDLAEEMLRTVNDALIAAQEASNTHEGRRAARIEEVRARLGQLRQLRVRAAGFVTEAQS